MAWRSLPTQVNFEVTHRCNFRCVHCYLPQSAPVSKEMPISTVRRVLKDLARAGVLQITFTGGEPFVRRNFLDLVQAAREMRFSVKIITNGSLLTRAKIRRLKKLKPTKIEVSLYGASEETYHRVTGMRGMFSHAVRCLDALAEAKIPVEVKTVLLRENAADLDECKRLAARLGFGIMLSPLLTAALDGSHRPLKHALAPRAVCRLVKDGNLRAPKRRKLLSSPCGVGRDAPLIGPDGTLYPCLEIRTPLGHLPGEKLGRIWRTSKVLSDLRKLTWSDYSRCNRCRLVEFCSVCPGAHDRAGGRKRDTYQCRIMKAMEKSGRFDV